MEDLAQVAQKWGPKTTPYHGQHGYNCHMAVIFWALGASGRSEGEARDRVETIARKYCNLCSKKEGSGHAFNFQPYGAAFGGLAHSTDKIQCAVGDVIILPNQKNPMHTMVVVSKQGGIKVVGFNNANTFRSSEPPPPEFKYDSTVRDLSQRVAPNDNPAFVIKQSDFISKVLTEAGLTQSP
jgi:hypothetical protein